MIKKSQYKMPFQKPNVTHSLGLDLGIASVGWAVVARKINPEKPNELPIYSLHDFGVHLFSPPGDLKKGVSTAAERRGFRSSRRLIRRRTQRIKRMQVMLKISGYDYMTDKIPKFKETNHIFKKGNIFTVSEGYQNIYLLKYKALREAITPAELYYILLHSCKRRGYLNKFEDDKGKKTEFDSIQKRTEDLLTIPNHTISEAILNDKRFHIADNKKGFVLYVHNGKLSTDNKKVGKSNYRWLFSREAVKNELTKILNFQIKQHPKDSFWQNVAKFEEDLLKNVYEQRDFEVGGKCWACQQNLDKQNSSKLNCIDYRRCSRYGTFADKIGKCLFYPSETRGHKSDLLFQAWHLALELSKMLQGLANWNVHLPKELYSQILRQAFANELNLNSFKKTLKEQLTDKQELLATILLTKNNSWKEGVKFVHNYIRRIHELPELKKLVQQIDFTKSPEQIIKQLADPKNILNQLGLLIADNKTPKRLRDKIQKCLTDEKISLTENELDLFLFETGSFTGRAKVSFSRMKDQLKIFLEGNPNISEKDNDYAKIVFSTPENQKPFSQIRDKDMETNPVVCQATNEIRKVLKALDNVYGEFKSITIEIGNEVSKSLNERKRLTKIKNQNEEIHIQIRDILERIQITPTNTNVLRYKLWSQQQENCLYCGQQILLENIDNRSFQIDHIVPRSIWGDDSINNKVLVCDNCNQRKKNQLPLQFLSSTDKPGFKIRVDNAFKSKILLNQDKVTLRLSKQKKIYLLLENTEGKEFDEFLSQALNDTRYIGKWFSAYVRKQVSLAEYKTKVLVMPGQITSFLRRKWLNNSPWGMEDKVREITHFHHAVDAMVLAQIRNQTFIELIYDIFNLDKAWQQKCNSEDRWLESNTFKYENLMSIIIKKWTNLNDKFKNIFWEHLLFLKNVKKNSNIFSSIFLRDFPEQLERRIPVLLSISKDEENEKFSPKFEALFNEKEWKKRQINNSDLEENQKFPHISRRKKYKLPKSIFALQKFGFRGSNNEAKTKVFRLWVNKDKKFDSKIEALMINACLEVAVRQELQKIVTNNKTSFRESFKKEFFGIDEFDKLLNKIEKTISAKNKSLPKNLIQPLIDFQFSKIGKTIKQNLKNWIKDFKEEKLFMVRKDGTVSSLESYYGFVILPEENSYQWITNYQANQIFKNSKFKNSKEFNWINKKQNLFVPNTIYRQYNKYFDKEITMNYSGKKGKEVYVFPNSLVYKDDNKYLPMSGSKSTNSIATNEMKMLEVDILGNLLKSVKILPNSKTK